MHTLPFVVYAAFTLALIYAITMFMRATGAKRLLLVLLPWMMLQGILSCTGFFEATNTLPPRFIAALLPPLLLIIAVFASPAGRRFISGIDVQVLTLIHLLRIPVELTLYGLFLAKGLPQVMTFEGRNLDIIAGVTALPVWWLTRNSRHPLLLLSWNLVSLGLLLNIVVTAILCAPSPFQQIGFEQPNVAVFWFPFIWLPAVLVPMVLFSHIVSITLLLKRWRMIRWRMIY